MNKQAKDTKLLVILGPTATGKTDLALELAKKFNGELIACDSRQVYKGLDLATGKMPGKKGTLKIRQGEWIVDGIPIHLYDVSDINQQFNVYDYVKQSRQVINQIIALGKLPIIVGGTGLYLQGLLEGLSDMNIPRDQKLRDFWEKLDLTDIQKKLQKELPKKWVNLNNSDRNNKRRLIRYLEIHSMYPYKKTKNKFGGLEKDFIVLKVGLNAPRSLLYKRIDDRVISRINQGMVEEVKRVVQQGVSIERLRELGLECRVLADFISGEIADKERMIKVLQYKIHAYARRQETWFKKMRGVIWFDISKPEFKTQVAKSVSGWYHSANVSKN